MDRLNLTSSTQAAPFSKSALTAVLCSATLLCSTGSVLAQTPQEGKPTPGAAVAPKNIDASNSVTPVIRPVTPTATGKDIVLDNGASPPVSPSVANLTAQTGTAGQAYNVMSDQPPKAQAPAARRAVFSAAMADLGLHLLRSEAHAAGHAQGNAVVSPHGVANTLGMLHAGAAGRTASELAGALEPGATGGRMMREGLKDLTQNVQTDASAQWLSLNRLWVDKSVASDLSGAYTQTLKDTLGADGVMLNFSEQGQAARTAINQWASAGTKGLIPEIVPAGVLKPNTRMVLTNANYFKGEWVSSFKTSDTRNATFFAEKQASPVPTMHQTLTVREGLVDGVYVMELPFKGGNFSMLLAMPPLGHTIQALESDLMGADIASWQKALQPQRVMLALPKFEIAPKVISLNQALQAAGVSQSFNEGADFSGIFKQGSKSLKLDDVLHSAGIKVNEEGTVAASVTAAVMGLKSISVVPKDLPKRQFNRPFVFALVHVATGAPLFMGRVGQP